MPLLPPNLLTRSTYRDFEHAVRHLEVHAVPLHQWPGAGRAGQHAAWQSSPWLTTTDYTLIRPDYFGSDPVTVRAFSDDLLVPLLGDLTSGAYASTQVLNSFKALEPDNLILLMIRPSRAAAQQYLACVRRALIGDRGPKAFQEAARIWHRRAAAVAALRNEHQTDRPGWPPLCPAWTSPCGTFQIVPLTTAEALVEEGNAHRHCVGTYYETCRRGTTQILSLRANGRPMVTAEILLDDRISSLRVAQFKGLNDEVPDDPALHQVMRNFLHNLRSGVHPLNREELRAYFQWARQHYFYSENERPLMLDHARQAFPLYLTLLPRGTPNDFDGWCRQTSIKDELNAALRHMTQQRQNDDV